MIQDFLETALKEELNNHLNNKRNIKKDPPEEDFINSNRNNGYNSKTVKAEIGNCELNTIKDRNNTFEFNIARKNKTILN